MQTILIVIHLLVVVALIGMILMQRSEGGALGMGGGGGGGVMSARGAANVLTRATGILAAVFFATSLALSLLARYQAEPTDIFNNLPQGQTQQDGGSGGILDELGGAPSAPTPENETQAPAPTDGAEAPSPSNGATEPESQVPTGQ